MSEMIEFPKFLYRGDSDKENVRKIRATWNSGLLMTGLSQGGNGREIFLNPLESLVHRHVAPGWNKTHFLSFTTDIKKAFYYGANDSMYHPTSSNDEWDFAIFTLATDIFSPDSIVKLKTGVYQASYSPSSREFLPLYTILLIDVATFLYDMQLSCSEDFSKSIFSAKRDKEWLVYPATPMRDSDEFTSKLDTGCITNKEVYKLT